MLNLSHREAVSNADCYIGTDFQIREDPIDDVVFQDSVVRHKNVGILTTTDTGAVRADTFHQAQGAVNVDQISDIDGLLTHDDETVDKVVGQILGAKPDTDCNSRQVSRSCM